MELPASPSSHHFGMRKPGEQGLAEWAQKIRALQRQVDADEEEEHRKLEQEIAASRLARVGRSTGYARPSLDPAPGSYTSSTAPHPSEAPGEETPISDRHHQRAEALQKLVGKSHPRPQIIPSSSSSLPTPTSLATFIGGRATGPRLNRHAPQQDVTDPTLFEQRNINSSSAPHPVFRRGGIAMPRLTSQEHRAVSPSPDPEYYAPVPTASTQDRPFAAKDEIVSLNAVPVPASAGDHLLGKESSRQPRSSAASTALKRYMQHVEQAASPHAAKPSFELDTSRPRTVSTPAGAHPTLGAKLPLLISQSQSRPVSPRTPISLRNPNLETRSSPSKSPISSSSKTSTPAFIAPKKSAIENASSPLFSVKLPAFSASTPSLPRPDASTPKGAPLAPQHRAPSLPPPTGKDPTPSISRLKGRGFVQSMVKASSALEAAAVDSTMFEVGRVGPAKRSSLVASRWKPESSSSLHPETAPPVINSRKSWAPGGAPLSGQKSVSQRKSWTTLEPPKSEPPKSEPPESERLSRALEHQNTGRSVRAAETHLTGRSSRTLEPQNTGRSVRKVPSLPALSTPSRPSTPPPASPGGHGIGSSSTMFSYIKPMKTGDDPATGHSHSHSRPATPHSHPSAVGSTATHDMDELGHTGVGVGGDGRRNGVAGFPAPSGRPLVHLTKGRPKPKKASRKHTGRGQSLLETGTSNSKVLTPDSPTVRSPTRSVAAQGVSLQPAPTRIPVHSTRAFVAPSHTDPLIPFSTFQPIAKPDIPKHSISDRWNEQALPESAVPNVQEKPSLVELAGAYSLPSLLIPLPPSQRSSETQPSSASPRSPRRQSRIPSTGSRALVMDVARALEEAQVSTESEAVSKSSATIIKPRQTEHHVPPMEKRKSSFDKYSAFGIPALLEEHTVAQAPDVGPQCISLGQVDDTSVEIPHETEPLPFVDLDELLLPPFDYQHNLDVSSISVDVLSVAGATATSVNCDTAVFYDSEILVIVNRFKTKSTGLVETTLWSWEGRRGQIGEREERKLKDMARHYGTKLRLVHQGCEPPELVHALGGRLTIRQGTRSHWSAENTTMHQVRLVHGNVFIDEYDLHVSNLCSAFSYCLTLLGTSFVWHGKGSLPKERQAALEYAQSLAEEGSPPVELVEGVSDDNEMFWMMLGDADYANADYWKWRPNSEGIVPRIWRVNASSAPPLVSVPAFSTQPNVNLSVYLVDCIWELFVLVGTAARSSRQDIRLALFTARVRRLFYYTYNPFTYLQDLSSRNAARRPFTPPVHVLILPSKLPLDFRLHFRDLDEEYMNGTPPPDHMNLLQLSEALFDVGNLCSFFPTAGRQISLRSHMQLRE
ncbi:hypothetical protein B0F90DRAFT_1948159 [Multifurca ochricompacta]|uniref:DUF7904 domain-containing protein n=1 Tax=Multifurca ochricompacta TaxID=376703 RepID=A0AAD4QR43_9AGAM|nr:hypothetical protein B0F90DRAFT_1948159 [Multifurca ochricompacta]